MQTFKSHISEELKRIAHNIMKERMQDFEKVMSKYTNALQGQDLIEVLN